MDYLIRLAQMHEDFRLAEIRSLSSFFSIEIDILFYAVDSPFLLVRITSYPRSTFASAELAARALIARSVLSSAIYELWGSSTAADDDDKDGHASYPALHADVQCRTNAELWWRYKSVSFKFSVDTYCSKRSPAEQREIINGFRFLGFEGPIRMQGAEVEFTVFEEWDVDRRFKVVDTEPPTHTIPPHSPSTINGNLTPLPTRAPHRLFFGRLLAPSSRGTLITKHSLKTRPYISTTSMDATLALVTANLAHAGPGQLVLDPFVGTGGFLVAAAEFGSYVWGSDIDGRSFRGTGSRRKTGEAAGGKGCSKGVGKNFHAYQLEGLFGDCFVSDLTHSPLRQHHHHHFSSPGEDNDSAAAGWLDAIICDPPYGVREGLKVLGWAREPGPDRSARVADDGNSVPTEAHTLPGYIAPKKPYSFDQMLVDILAFAAARLVVGGGRLAFWMPSPNEQGEDGDDTVPEIPSHPELELVECCVQRFNKWSRRLLVYRRKSMLGLDAAAAAVMVVDERFKRQSAEKTRGEERGERKTASDLNAFRRRYFQGFADKGGGKDSQS